MMTSLRKTLKTLVWSAQNQLISSEICLENNHKIGRFLPIAFWWSLPWKLPRNYCEIGRFFREFVPKNPLKFDFSSATCQKPWLKRTTKYVWNIIFHFVYRSVQHAFLVVLFHLFKLAHKIYLDLSKNIYFLDVCFSSKLANCKCTHGTKSAKLNALENSFGLYWDNLYILWKNSQFVSQRFLKIYVHTENWAKFLPRKI